MKNILLSIILIILYIIINILIAFINIVKVEADYLYLKNEERQGAGVYWDKVFIYIHQTKWKYIFPIAALITYFV